MMLKNLAIGVFAVMLAGSASAITVQPSEISGTLSIVPNGSAASFNGYIGLGEGGTDDFLLNVGGSGGSTTATKISWSLFNGTESIGLYSNAGGNTWNLITQAIGNSNWSLDSATMTVSALLASGTYLLHVTGPVGTLYSGTVSAVPLPGAALLFGSALLGAGALRRKQSAGKKAEVAIA